MGKFARPNSYTGKQSNQSWTGQVRAATRAEALAGASSEVYISPSTLDAAVDIVVGAATETHAGIAELATQAETNTGTNDATIVTPLKLKTNLTTPPAIGATTPAAGTFTELTANTSITSNGNIIKNVAGNKDVYTSVATTTAAGANSAGTVTLVGGTATIATTSVTASSKIRIYRQGVGATGAAALGILTIGTIVANTSFDINSVQAADATALQASDVSVVFWEIVN